MSLAAASIGDARAISSPSSPALDRGGVGASCGGDDGSELASSAPIAGGRDRAREEIDEKKKQGPQRKSAGAQSATTRDRARTVASLSTAIQLLSRSAVPSALICAGVNARARSSAADTTACAVCEPSSDGGGESTTVLPALPVL
jgi:hypothetical protein